jgi:hypothetical protein
MRRSRTRVPQVGLASLFESCGGARLLAGRYRDARCLPGVRLARAWLVGAGGAGGVADGGRGVDEVAVRDSPRVAHQDVRRPVLRPDPGG